MNRFSKIVGSLLRSAGFVAFPLFLYYFLAFAFCGGIKETGLSGPVALGGLVAILLGGWLRKKGGDAVPPPPGSRDDQEKASYTNIVGALTFSIVPGAGQAFNGEYRKAIVFSENPRDVPHDFTGSA